MVAQLSMKIADRHSVPVNRSVRREVQRIGHGPVPHKPFRLDELWCATHRSKFLRDQFAQLVDELANGVHFERFLGAREGAAPRAEFFCAEEAAPLFGILFAGSGMEHVQNAREARLQQELRDQRVIFVFEAQQKRAAEWFAGEKFEVSLRSSLIGHDAAPFFSRRAITRKPKAIAVPFVRNLGTP